jgi:hypothetical protein
MFEHSTQRSSIVLEIANIRARILMKQDDDDVDLEISNDESEDLGESTMSSDIEEDDVDIRQEVLRLDQARRDKTIRTTRVPQPKKRSRADTVIARAPLPNLRHPAGAIAPPLLKCQKSVINISRESDLVQALPLPSAKNISIRAEWLHQNGHAPSVPSETPRWCITLRPASIPRVALHIALRSPFRRFFSL